MKADAADFFARKSVRWVAGLLLAVLMGGFVRYAAYHPVDFGPYTATARAMLGGSRELYGPKSGLGYPMVYRSAPLFLLLFVPLALLPVPVAAGLWALLKFAALYGVIRMIQRLLARNTAPAERLGASWLIVFLICASYVVQEFRGGNMQFFIFAAAAAGFCFLERRPALAGAWFALGISLKVVPAFFVPYLLVRGHRRAVASLIVFVVVLSLLPALYFGFAENTRLLAKWLVTGIAEPTPATWGINPDHSLRGVMTRYLSTVPYAQMPDPNYRNINFGEVSPEILHVVWLLLDGGAYAALLVLAWRLGRREKEVTQEGTGWSTAMLEYALLFCASLLLAPLTQRIYMVALLFPAIVLAHELHRLPKTALERRTIWGLAIGAILCFAVPPLIPGRVNQRLLAVYSPDFWGTLVLSVCLMVLLHMRLRTGSSAETAT